MPSSATSSTASTHDCWACTSTPRSRAKPRTRSSSACSFCPARSRRLAGSELEVTLAHNLLLFQIYEKRGALAHHAVEGPQVPDIHAPAAVTALARRTPLGSLEIAKPTGSRPSRPCVGTAH